MVLITFSGVDGAGKSTQVKLTQEYFRQLGKNVRAVSFVQLGLSTMLINSGLFPRLRRKRGPGRQSQVNPHESLWRNGGYVQHRDKLSVRTRRALTYFVDIIIFTGYLAMARLAGVEVMICDRYFYDKLVNLPNLRSPAGRILRRICPRPTLAFLLLVHPETASGRAKEFSPDFFEAKVKAYEMVQSLCPGLIGIPSSEKDETWRRITTHLGTIFRPSDRNDRPPE